MCGGNREKPIGGILTDKTQRKRNAVETYFVNSSCWKGRVKLLRFDLKVSITDQNIVKPHLNSDKAMA